MRMLCVKKYREVGFLCSSRHEENTKGKSWELKENILGKTGEAEELHGSSMASWDQYGWQAVWSHGLPEP